MKNKLTDLNNYLFEQLERLNDDTASEEELEKELKKSDKVTKIAATIIKNADTQLKAIKQLESMGIVVNSYETAKMLGLGGDDGKNQLKIENKKI